MGWCSATEIMDTALEAALELLASMRPEPQVVDQRAVDEVLRPFVRKVTPSDRRGV